MSNNSVTFVNCKGIVQVRKKFPGFLKGTEMAVLPVIKDSYLMMTDGIITSFGPMSELPESVPGNTINASGRFILPAFIDSHTHLVFAASRESEFVDKTHGLSYQEIAAKGGGILNSAKKLRKASKEALLESARMRLKEIMSTGTATVEIKSGYGLDLKSEIKMLEVIKELSETSPMDIKSTFLGAHAFPKEKTKEAYIQEVKQEMIPEIARQGLADYIDVFCESGFFSVPETEEILEVGLKYGLKPKLHANQLTNNGGVQLGIRKGAISVDHLENIGVNEIEALKNSNVIPTLLPGAAFYLRLPYPPAREMINAGLGVALASDFNPGSSPTGNMQMILSLACIGMKMTPNEAMNAATINTAAALEMESGFISTGQKGNIILTEKIPSTDYIPYAFGTNHVAKLFINGVEM